MCVNICHPKNKTGHTGLQVGCSPVRLNGIAVGNGWRMAPPTPNELFYLRSRPCPEIEGPAPCASCGACVSQPSPLRAGMQGIDGIVSTWMKPTCRMSSCFGYSKPSSLFSKWLTISTRPSSSCMIAIRRAAHDQQVDDSASWSPSVGETDTSRSWSDRRPATHEGNSLCPATAKSGITCSSALSSLVRVHTVRQAKGAGFRNEGSEGTASASSGYRRLPIQPFSQNLFLIAFSRNGSSAMEKRDCCDKLNGWPGCPRRSAKNGKRWIGLFVAV
ncbi:unnamed protein product [Acanthosepion pharaonis]|uniref:Uncharacterized protein n=1 Tax=Acanthosepion pharaonis TaxID=158019 RepID=A0A812DGY1_ACAPH|nr:unnamed protein product [Sepia pharaonis]